MTVVDNEMERLWGIIIELSNQLTTNKLQTEMIRKQSEQLREQSIHASTGFVLRRYNTDISKEEFESELERVNAKLVIDNRNLQNENRQLNALLKEHETTLDKIMGKFRGFAHSTQKHELEITRHYESQLLNHMIDAVPYPHRYTSYEDENSSQNPTNINSNHNPNVNEASTPYHVINQKLPLQIAISKQTHSPPSSDDQQATTISDYPQNLCLASSSSPSSAVMSTSTGGVPPLHDPLYLSVSLAHISELVRKAYRSLNGEHIHDDGNLDEDSSAFPNEHNNYPEDMIPPSNTAFKRLSSHFSKNTGEIDGQVSASTSTSSLNTPSEQGTQKESDVSSESSFGGGEEFTHDPNQLQSDQSIITHTSHVGHSRRRRRPCQPTQGGYLSIIGEPSEEALERDIELERVHYENEQLRNLLEISNLATENFSALKNTNNTNDNSNDIDTHEPQPGVSSISRENTDPDR